MNPNKTLKGMVNRLPEWARSLVLAGYRGSISHGTYIGTEIDDTDVFCIFVHPKDYYLGLPSLVHDQEHFNTNGEALDINADELRRFVRQLYKGNPNAHFSLWLKPEHYLLITHPAQMLLSSREAFLSVNILNAIGGHAQSQVNKLSAANSLEQKDQKAAAHAIRLLYTGIRLARDRELRPWLDETELSTVMEVKTGQWNKPKIELKIQALLGEFSNEKEKSGLTYQCDWNEIDKILLNLLQTCWDHEL
jgi:predicted nucleotidyltransferase